MSAAESVPTGEYVQGAAVVYVDENAINRALADMLLKEGGAVCTSVPTMSAMIDALSRRAYDVAVLDLDTATADRDGFELAKREPRFRELPLVAVGLDAESARAIGAEFFVQAPLDPTRLLSAVAEARGGRLKGGSGEAIARTALLAKVGGRLESAIELLTHFVHDYSGHGALMEEALKRGEREKAHFLLRNLRAASGAVGADDLYRLAADVQEELEREEPFRAAELSDALRAAVRKAAELRNELASQSSLAAGVSSLRGFASAAVDIHLPSPARFDDAKVEDSRAKGGEDRQGMPYLLAVDDSDANLKFITACLSDEYSVLQASSGEEALVAARGRPVPALILLDVTMPGIDGYEACRLLKEDPRTRSIPVIFLTSLSKEEDEERGLALGAVDYIRKPFSVPILKARVRSQLELLRYREYLETLVEERTRELRETQREVVFRLALAAEYRDNDTGSHIKRIGYYAMTLAERLGFPRHEADILYYASSMHDVGKIGIPDNILLKPGKLEPDEWAIMKDHTTIGAGLLEGHPSELLRVASRIALTHHEKWDGKGYPAGLAADAIPMEGRIVAVCDVFDALLSERPYKKPWTYDRTLDEINNLSGKHFDPSIVRAFNDAFPEFVRIKERFDG